jgi:SAM-dependent methyltransferase
MDRPRTPNTDPASSGIDSPLTDQRDLDRVTLETYDRFAPNYTSRYFATRALDDEMERFLSYLPPTPRILDAGCGPGHQSLYFTGNGALAVGLDYSFPMLREGKTRVSNLTLVQGDLLMLPFPPNSFDGIWARASLLHMDARSQRAALGEFHRVLREEGILYAAVRQGEGEELRTELQMGVELRRYFRFWQPGDWHRMIQSAGFTLLESGIEDGDPEDWLWVYARRG